MSALIVKQLLETALAAILPALPTAWQNVPFERPVNQPWQKADVLFAAPENPEVGNSFYREQGIFQISLFYPLNVGLGVGLARAQLIRSLFYRGSSFTNGAITAIIAQTPEIDSGASDETHWMLAVKCRFYANIE